MPPSAEIEILPLPEVPPELKEAARIGTVVPFIGAGVSQLAGCPGWDAFASNALKFFVENGDISYAKFDQISRLSARVKLSLATELERVYKRRIKFGNLLKPNQTRIDVWQRVHSGLSKLGNTFVTTNYDELLDTLPLGQFSPKDVGHSESEPTNNRHPIFNINDINVSALSIPNAVIHIHGSVLNSDSMVLTTKDYLERYSSHRIDGATPEENPFLTFLEELFDKKTVLFFGYGLQELEILEYVIQKAGHKRGTQGQRETPKHFVIQGYFSHEVEVANTMKSYFLEFGIGLLPFLRDNNDWGQLENVIEHLAREAPVSALLASQKRLDMEALLQ